MRTKPDRRVSRTRRALKEALTDLILEKGYESVTVQDVIDRADVGRSTFYAHFPDKAALLTRLARDAGAEFAAAADQWVGEEPSAGPEAVERVLGSMLKVYRKHAPVLQAMREVAAGQEWDWLNDGTEAGYWRAVQGKAEAGAVLAASLGAVLARAPDPSLPALRSFARALGRLDQIEDDLADFATEPPSADWRLRAASRAAWR